MAEIERARILPFTRRFGDIVVVNQLGYLLLRADASSEIGMGHAMRCLALAHAWQDRGGAAVFAASSLSDSLVHRLEAEGITFEPINAQAGTDKDLSLTLALAQRYEAQVLALDGYRFDERYQQALSNQPFALFTIDDTGSLSNYHSHLVLNQNVLEQPDLYPSRSPHTRLLLGPAYALLRRELLQHPARARERNEPPRHLLVTMGGSDPSGSTEWVVRRLLDDNDSNLAVRIVVGELSPHRSLIETILQNDARFKVVVNPADMSPLYAWADIAIAAGGSSNWELCAFGVPRIVIVTADNQLGVAQTLAAANAAIVLAPQSENALADFDQAFASLMRNAELRGQMQSNGRQLVDGQGAARCVDAILESMYRSSKHDIPREIDSTAIRSTGVTLRLATIDDAELLFEWRNDPVTRQASRNSDPIEFDSHRQWLAHSLSSDHRKLWIALANDIPVGTVRLDLGPVSELSWNVAPNMRGQGFGKKMVRLAIVESTGPVSAVIRDDNSASRRLAESLGFTLKSTEGRWLTYQLTPRKQLQ